MPATTPQRPVLKDHALPYTRQAVVELPTLIVLLATYGGWLAITSLYGRWSLWIVAPVAAVLVTLHSSLQHEIVHGHPTRWRQVNRILGSIPLALWLPFERYRMTHLVHHVNDRLTDPIDDPESYYWKRDDWARISAFGRVVFHVQQTLLGRIIVGSFWRIGHFLNLEVQALARNEPGVRAAWVEHVVWCVPVILWIKIACAMPLWVYVIAVVIPSNGLLLIRSFAEHRALGHPNQRTAIVEGSWLLGPLYLFNNLHALHHKEPLMPWYEYNARYREIRDELVAANGGLVYATYFDVARRYLLWAHDSLEHPTDGVPQRR